MDKKNTITRYLHASGWLEELQCRSLSDVSFLAAGEYNENWIVSAASQDQIFNQKHFVFRINHGSQLGLDKEQIRYEFEVLSALKNSAVTPIPYFEDAGNFDPAFDHGVLLMEYISGTPLDYTQDLDHAAKVFAAVHTQPVPEQNNFIHQKNPVADIVTESLGLLARFEDHPRHHFLSRYKEYAGLHQSIEELAILTGILEKTIILRGLSWCYMAWYEYTQQDRTLKNNDTFSTIERYLDNLEWFLQ
jgi:hypothetical protein